MTKFPLCVYVHVGIHNLYHAYCIRTEVMSLVY